MKDLQREILTQVAAGKLSAEEGAARQALARKYFLMRFPWLWSRKNIFLEITLRPA